MAGRLLMIGELNDDLNELKSSFEALGLTVDTAPDNLAGLEQGREFQPDLVVTEILTNRLSGFELASRISSGAAGFAAPLIFYTEFYRDEKARREVIAKYGAMKYFVRPFQKEALKKWVTAHFQDFLSNLPGTPIVGSTAEAAASNPALTTVPVLSLAEASAEKPPAHVSPGQPVQSGKAGGVLREVPSRFRAFSPTAQVSSSNVFESEPQAAGPVADERENQPVAVPTVSIPRAETEPVAPRASKPSTSGLLLPVEKPSWIGRLVQSTPGRIAAAVILAVLAVYLVRGRFESGNKEVKPSQTPVSTQPSPSAQAAVEPPANLASLPARVPATAPPEQEPPVAEGPTPAAEPAKVPLSSEADLSTKPDSAKRETADSHTAAGERSPVISIQDVTGSGRGPVLRKMKPIRLSEDVLSSLATKSVVVRVVIDNAGKVTEVAPLNQEGSAVSLPPDALATIRQWEFSRSRHKEAGEAVKYFSLKVQNPR